MSEITGYVAPWRQALTRFESSTIRDPVPKWTVRCESESSGTPLVAHHGDLDPGEVLIAEFEVADEVSVSTSDEGKDGYRWHESALGQSYPGCRVACPNVWVLTSSPAGTEAGDPAG